MELNVAAHNGSRLLFAAVAAAVLSFVGVSPTLAASTDIVPQSSTIRDVLARLSTDGAITEHADQLLDDRLLTRADAALSLEKGLGLHGETPATLRDPFETAAVRSALIAIRAELTTDHVNVDAVLKALPSEGFSYDGSVKAEGRIGTGGTTNSPGTGTDGIYRATVLGNLGTNAQYGVSVSNQAEDEDRIFTNDIGPHDFSALSQAYVNFSGRHGLNFLVGRTDDNWGTGTEGGALISDNAPPLDQLRLSFPFSLGERLGRNWSYTQLASTYDEDGERKYLQARKIELSFSSHWSAQYDEAVKSTTSSFLLRAPLPFLIAKGIDLNSDESDTEFIGDLGLNYLANQDFRVYGQLLINDIKSPFRGHIVGFDVGQGGVTPQRLGYIVGSGYNSHHGTDAALEYSTADPTTFQDTNKSLSWTKGAYEFLGLPDGPNFKQVSGLFSQDLTSKITLSAEGRLRNRFRSSYPSPDSQDIALSAAYHLDQSHSVSLTYHDYYQDAYPYAPGSPNYPVNSYTPPSEGNPGTSLTIHELDAGYELVF